MSFIKDLAKKLIDENPPEPPKDHDAEKLKKKAQLPKSEPQYPFPKASPTHHWLECENCGYRMMAIKALMGIFCSKCKTGSLRAVEEAEG